VASKLRTYTTSAGFFDLAVAAPSMKAALEAWGATSNLFHQGFARPTDDPKIVAAAMARPGVILRRPVGSNGAFTEHAALPKLQDISRGAKAPARRRTKATRPAPQPVNDRAVDDRTARAAAAAFEREQHRRERQARREEAARTRERERRDRAIAAAEAALAEGRKAHEASVGKIGRARAALDRKLEAEEARWTKKKERLGRALRRARSPGHLRLV
jgi:hypothetical protein